MREVNLRELYPDAYVFDEYVEVSDEVYEALCEFENEEEAYHRRRHRNKAIYSLDVGDGIENDATSPPQTPEEIFMQRELNKELLSLIKSLPRKQAERIYGCFYLGLSATQIAMQENKHPRRVSESIQKGIKKLRERISVNFL